MDFGIDTIIYLIIGIIFVLAQATRKRNSAKGKAQIVEPVNPVEQEEPKEELSAFWKEFLGTDLTANQVVEPDTYRQIPPDFSEPEVFHRMEPAAKEPVLPQRSFNDPDRNDHGRLQETESQMEESRSPEPFDLRTAVVYSVIMERKYA